MFSQISSIAALAGAAAAAGVNQAPNVPVAGQIGALDFGVTCEIPILGNMTFGGFFTATAPIQANSGQKIYYDDLIADVTVPGSLTGLAALVGSHSVNANIKVALSLDNATPSNYQVFPNGLQINNVTFSPGKPVTVRVPTNGTLAPIGPITMGAAGKTHLIHLGEIDIGLTILGSNGTPVFGPLPITCPPQAIPYDIGIVNILPANTLPAGDLSLSTAGQNVFAPITNGQETGSFRFPYSCTFASALKSDVDLTITGTVPTYFNPGQKFSVTDSFAYLRLPASLVSTITSAFPSAGSIRTNANDFEIGVTNGSPASINVLSTPVSVTTPVTKGQELDIAIPASGTLTIGPITAGAPGQELFLDSRNATGTADILDTTGKSLGSVDFVCSPKYASQLIGIPVTTLKAPAISS